MVGNLVASEVSDLLLVLVGVAAALRRIRQADQEALLRYLMVDLAVLETVSIMNRVLIVLAAVKRLEILGWVLGVLVHLNF